MLSPNENNRSCIFIIEQGVRDISRTYLNMSETYLEPSQTSQMKLFARIVNDFRGAFRIHSNT